MLSILKCVILIKREYIKLSAQLLLLSLNPLFVGLVNNYFFFTLRTVVITHNYNKKSRHDHEISLQTIFISFDF